MAKFAIRPSFVLVGGTICGIALGPVYAQQLGGQANNRARITAPASGAQAPAVQSGTGSGVTVTLDYRSTLRYDDNLGMDDPSLGSTSRWDNTFALGIANQTPNSQLNFDLTGLHRSADRPVIGTDTGFYDPTALLSYSTNSANSSLTAVAEYRESDLTFNRGLSDINQDGVIDDSDILTDRGTRIATRAGLTLQTGINDPIGFIFNYSLRQRDYRDTTDPGLFENSISNYSLTTLLQLSPVLQGNVSLNYTDYTAEDARRTERQTTTISTGVTYDVSAVTTVDVSLGISQVDETRRAVPSSTTDENFVGSFSVTRDLPSGTANAQVDQTFTSNGSRTNATVGRTFLLPNGTLGFNVGATYGPFEQLTPIGDLTYVHSLSSSQITASLRRRVGTSIQDRETQQTLAKFNYDYFINPVSSVSFGVTYVDQQDDGTGASNQRQRADFNASYTRAITQDWGVTVGYQRSYDDFVGSGSADGNSVYLTLGRQFVLKP